jgi:hypothetical protein
MKRRVLEIQQMQESLAAAEAKVRLWQARAEKARLAGRTVDAQRCDDKVRDWASRVKHMERSQSAVE